VALTDGLSRAPEVVSAAEQLADQSLLDAGCQSKAKSHVHEKLAFTCQIQAQNCFLIWWGEIVFVLG